MIPVSQAAAERRWAEGKWTIVGKGPTFDGLTHIDGWCVCLNHAVEQIGRRPVRYARERCVAHFIDLEAMEECGRAVAANASFLLMPWIPNREHHQQRSTVQELAEKHSVLREMDDAKRLLVYNRASSRLRFEGAPTVDPRYFSSEAVLEVLGACGVRSVRLVGIDGGCRYASAFNNLRPLSNRQPTFDLQFARLRAIRDRYNMAVENLT